MINPKENSSVTPETKSAQQDTQTSTETITSINSKEKNIMSNILANESIAPVQARRTNPRINPRNSTHIEFDFDGFKYEVGKTFDNDFDFFFTFIISYGGRPIEDYLKNKTRNGTTYQTARFPQKDKKNMKIELGRLLNYDTVKVTETSTLYVVHSANQEAVDFEMEKAAYQLRKAS